MGAVLGAEVVAVMRRGTVLWLLVGVVGACTSAGPAPEPEPGFRPRPLPPPLPDTSGWGVHVLALEQSGSGQLWAGTFGRGIWVLRESEGTGEREWEGLRMRPSDAASISGDYVNSLAFTEGGIVWYGTVGNGFGRSTDGGLTWRNWTQAELGPQWQYVAAQGIRTRGDTVYIATGDGLRITWDGGETWRCVQSNEAPDAPDACTERIRALPTSYLLSLAVGPDGRIWAGHLQGLSVSADAGLSWSTVSEGLPRTRIRAVTVNTDSAVWAASETSVYVDSTAEGRFMEANLRVPGLQRLPGSPRALVPSPPAGPNLQPPPLIALSFGMAAGDPRGTWRVYYLPAAEAYRPTGDLWSVTWWGRGGEWPVGASATGLNLVLAGNLRPPGAATAEPAPPPSDPVRPGLRRPIDGEAGNPYVDPTYLYGATLGGTFNPNPGVEFNNPPGTAVHAVADGIVVFAGEAEAGSKTVAILHDTRWADHFVYSSYHDASAVEVQHGQRVTAGQVIARVGSTGRSANNHLHFEVHVAPVADSSQIVGAGSPFALNPQLWLDPLPGTGIVAGRVEDAEGNPVPGARVRGLVLAYPTETPFSFVETYAPNAHPDAHYDENFAVGDVPAGEYALGVDIGDRRVWRRIRVEAGKVTFVVFSP